MKFLQQIDQLSSAPDILFLSFLGLGSGQMVSLINCYHQWNAAPLHDSSSPLAKDGDNIFQILEHMRTLHEFVTKMRIQEWELFGTIGC